MGDSPELELRGLRCARGGTDVIRGIDLELGRGRVLFVMGQAGSGKSILMKTAAGIALPAEGDVLFRGRSLDRITSREEAAFRKAAGFAFQDAALWANMSAFDNIALPLRRHEPRLGQAEVAAAVDKVGELVGLGPASALNLRPADFSAGQRKLIGLARALALDPELVFMDDPVVGLDEVSADRVIGIVEGLKARGRSLLVASSASDFAYRCADDVAVLAGGLIAARGCYDEAVAWDDPALRAVTGRLKARTIAAPRPDSLAGRWAAAFADEDFRIDQAERARPKDEPSGGDSKEERE